MTPVVGTDVLFDEDGRSAGTLRAIDDGVIGYIEEKMKMGEARRRNNSNTIRPSQRKPPGGLDRAMRNIAFMEAKYQLSVNADMTIDDRMAQIKTMVLEGLREGSPNESIARQVTRQIGNYNEAAFANFLDEIVTETIEKHHN